MKLSIKAKITIWFSIFIIILGVILIIFISLVSKTTLDSKAKSNLISRVDYNSTQLEYDDGKLEIDDDFIIFKNGISSAVYNELGQKIEGYIPNNKIEEIQLQDNSIRNITIEGEKYIIHDRLIQIKKYGNIWIRAATMNNENLISSEIYKASLILLPIFIILILAGGYFIAKNSLKPLEIISTTAEEIGDSGNLSKRIEIKNKGDEIYKLSKTFNNMFEKLENNFEQQKNFTSDASHELRNPISIILAQCEYAFENVQGEDELYEIIGDIQKQGYRMSNIIESLLKLTRIEQGIESLDNEKINLSKMLIEICDSKNNYPDKNIILNKKIMPNIYKLADKGLIIQLFDNLIGNAYKYGKQNGNITVELFEENDNILFIVEDDGIGISDDNLEKIWDRFYRIDKSRTYTKNAGLGLGLAIVNQIVNIYKGKIIVKSELDEGSKFIVIIPRNNI